MAQHVHDVELLRRQRYVYVYGWIAFFKPRPFAHGRALPESSHGPAALFEHGHHHVVLQREKLNRLRARKEVRDGAVRGQCGRTRAVVVDVPRTMVAGLGRVRAPVICHSSSS